MFSPGAAVRLMTELGPKQFSACSECGAMVPEEAFQTHFDWHLQQGNP
jgi:hypothetical protein